MNQQPKSAEEILENKNIGPGGFGDQFDNQFRRSLDQDQHPGGVTDIPFEEDWDLLNADFFPEHDEDYLYEWSDYEERLQDAALDATSPDD